MIFPNKHPLLNSKSISLREPRASDDKSYYECLTDKETIRQTSYNVKSIDVIKEWLEDYKKQFKEFKRMVWVIEDIKTKKFIGEITFFDIQLTNDKGEIGYFLNRNYWGKGIMTSLLCYVSKYLFNELKIKRIQAAVMAGNLGSCKVLENNGFEKEGKLRKYKKCRGKYRDFILYSKIKTK
jgi:ribosomal-protein-alanine N-acetyltransferase